MLKQKSPLMVTLLIGVVLMSGCSSSDGFSNSATEEVLVIDGYTLPPDPGEAGKETLLGIDSNDNGVRDDVERWIYKRYDGKKYQKTKTAIAMQYAKATQVILVDPEKAYEHKTFELMDRAQDCKWYWKSKNSIPYDETRIFDSEMTDKIFNTKERLMNYAKYNGALGGHIYKDREESINACDENIDLYTK